MMFRTRIPPQICIIRKENSRRLEESRQEGTKLRIRGSSPELYCQKSRLISFESDLMKYFVAEAEPLEGCVHKNQTFQKGVMFNDGCEALCSCGDSGKVTCKSRCPQVANNSSDQCVSVPDPNDPCCTVVFCDVTLADHDVNKISKCPVLYLTKNSQSFVAVIRSSVKSVDWSHVKIYF